MATPSHSELHRIAWNGIAITLPSTWQAKVSALQHLNFENNSEAIMELRWQNATSTEVDNFRKTLTKQYQELEDNALELTSIPANLQELFLHFEVQCYAGNKKSMPVLVFLYAPATSLFIMMRFYLDKAADHPLSYIQSIDFSKEKDAFFNWAIQDFQVRIPLAFQLSKYTMKAGLTVLQFNRGKTILNICRLALAEKRLKQQNLEEIFYSLLGEEKPLKPEHISTTLIRYKNAPSLRQQLVLRFQRKKPFRLAALWHDQDNDRLLGVYMEDIKPMNEEEYEMICAQYEILKA